MNDLWDAYRKGERQSSFLLLGLGMLAVAGGFLMQLATLNPLFQGIAWALIATGALTVWKGLQTLSGIHRRSRRWDKLEQHEPKTLLALERKSMQRLLKQMRQMQMLDMLIFLAGVALALAGSLGTLGNFALGNGVALSFQAGVLLSIDLFSGLRNGLYYQKLDQF